MTAWKQNRSQLGGGESVGLPSGKSYEVMPFGALKNTLLQNRCKLLYSLFFMPRRKNWFPKPASFNSNNIEQITQSLTDHVCILKLRLYATGNSGFAFLWSYLTKVCRLVNCFLLHNVNHFL